VAGRALRCGEPSLDVIGHVAAQSLRVVPVRGVAAVAIGVGGCQSVVVADVALRAVGDRARRRHLVVAGQGPPGHGVVKRRRVGPGNRVVAGRAVCRRECGTCRLVRWIVRVVPVGEMAAGIPAVGRRNRKRIVVANVALRTRGDLARRGHLVRVGQREARGAVIECRVGPVDGVVASRALRCGEARLNVIGDVAAQSLRVIPIRRVAAIAVGVRGCKGVVVADVALRAGRDYACRGHLVVARQGPTSHGVIKRGIRPRDRVMAGGAVGRGECGACRLVRWIVRLLPGGRVAACVPAVGRRDR